MRVAPPGQRGLSKRRRKRIKWLSSATRWRRVGEEQVYGDILLTRLKRKPVFYKVEAVTESGDIVECGLERLPKGSRGWRVILPGGEAVVAHTKRAAMKFISLLQVKEKEDGRRLGTGDSEESV